MGHADSVDLQTFSCVPNTKKLVMVKENELDLDKGKSSTLLFDPFCATKNFNSTKQVDYFLFVVT